MGSPIHPACVVSGRCGSSRRKVTALVVFGRVSEGRHLAVDDETLEGRLPVGEVWILLLPVDEGGFVAPLA